MFASRCRLKLLRHVSRIINDAPFSLVEKCLLRVWNFVTTGFFIVGGHLAFMALRNRFPGLLNRFGQLREGMFDEKRQ